MGHATPARQSPARPRSLRSATRTHYRASSSEHEGSLSCGLLSHPRAGGPTSNRSARSVNNNSTTAVGARLAVRFMPPHMSAYRALGAGHLTHEPFYRSWRLASARGTSYLKWRAESLSPAGDALLALTARERRRQRVAGRQARHRRNSHWRRGAPYSAPLKSAATVMADCVAIYRRLDGFASSAALSGMISSSCSCGRSHF